MIIERYDKKCHYIAIGFQKNGNKKEKINQINIKQQSNNISKSKYYKAAH